LGPVRTIKAAEEVGDGVVVEEPMYNGDNLGQYRKIINNWHLIFSIITIKAPLPKLTNEIA